MAHDLKPALLMNRFDQANGFFARASARPVRNRTEGGFNPLDQLDFAEEVFLAFFCLWRKELNR
jgi:hypothetical protein